MPPRRVTPKGQAAPVPQAETPAPAAKKPAAKKRAPAKKKDDKTFYVRNIRNVYARVTLFDGTRVELQPRGQRGDMYPLAWELKDDPILIQNVGLIFEVIREEVARDILLKQHTNQQVGQTTVDLLVNERGESMSHVNVTAPHEQQGTTVASLEQAPDGRFTQNNVELQRTPGAPPQQVQMPGSPGTIPNVPADVPADQVADWVARNSQGENLGDVLRGQVNVSVDPVQRT